MTKNEQKEALQKLVQVFLTTSELDVLIETREEIMRVFSSGTFVEKRKKELADTTLVMVANDMAKFINDAYNKQATAQQKLEINTSMVLLLTMYDVLSS